MSALTEIYNFIDKNRSRLFPDNNIKEICRVVGGSIPIYSSVGEDVNYPRDISRLLFRLVQCCGGKSVIASIEDVYCKLLGASFEEVEEFARIGEVLNYILSAYIIYDSSVLVGCKIDLPCNEHIKNIIPMKYSISIDSMTKIHELVVFWVSIYIKYEQHHLILHSVAMKISYSLLNFVLKLQSVYLKIFHDNLSKDNPTIIKQAYSTTTIINTSIRGCCKLVNILNNFAIINLVSRLEMIQKLIGVLSNYGLMRDGNTESCGDFENKFNKSDANMDYSGSIHCWYVVEVLLQAIPESSYLIAYETVSSTLMDNICHFMSNMVEHKQTYFNLPSHIHYNSYDIHKRNGHFLLNLLYIYASKQNSLLNNFQLQTVLSMGYDFISTDLMMKIMFIKIETDEHFLSFLLSCLSDSQLNVDDNSVSTAERFIYNKQSTLNKKNKKTRFAKATFIYSGDEDEAMDSDIDTMLIDRNDSISHTNIGNVGKETGTKRLFSDISEIIKSDRAQQKSPFQQAFLEIIQINSNLCDSEFKDIIKSYHTLIPFIFQVTLPFECLLWVKLYEYENKSSKQKHSFVNTSTLDESISTSYETLFKSIILSNNKEYSIDLLEVVSWYFLQSISRQLELINFFPSSNHFKPINLSDVISESIFSLIPYALHHSLLFAIRSFHTEPNEPFSTSAGFMYQISNNQLLSFGKLFSNLLQNKTNNKSVRHFTFNDSGLDYDGKIKAKNYYLSTILPQWMYLAGLPYQYPQLTSATATPNNTNKKPHYAILSLCFSSSDILFQTALVQSTLDVFFNIYVESLVSSPINSKSDIKSLNRSSVSNNDYSDIITVIKEIIVYLELLCTNYNNLQLSLPMALLSSTSRLLGICSFILCNQLNKELQSIQDISDSISFLPSILALPQSTTSQTGLEVVPNNVLNCPEQMVHRLLFLVTVNKWAIQNKLTKDSSNHIFTQKYSTLLEPLIGLVESLLNLSNSYNLQLQNITCELESSSKIFQQKQSDESESNDYFFEDMMPLDKTHANDLAPDKSPDKNKISTSEIVICGSYGQLPFFEFILNSQALVLSCKIYLDHLKYLISKTENPEKRQQLQLLSSVKMLDVMSLNLTERTQRLIPLSISNHNCQVKLGQALCVICFGYVYHYKNSIDAYQNVISKDIISLAMQMMLITYEGNGKKRPTGPNIVIPGLMKLVKYTALLYPKISIMFLSQIISIWVDLEDHINQNLINEEIYILGTSGILSHLLVSNIELTVTHIISPIFLSNEVTSIVTQPPNQNNSNDSGNSALILNVIINHIEGKIDHNLFLQCFSPAIISHLVTDSFISGNKSEKMAILNHIKMMFPNIPFPNEDLIESAPAVIHKIMMSNYVQQLDETSLINGQLHAIFIDISNILSIPVDEQSSLAIIDNNTRNPISIASFHVTLLLLLWDLGSDLETKKKSFKALRVYCTIYQSQSWKIDRMSNKEMNHYISECMATIFSTNFLFCMANLWQSPKNLRSRFHREQALRSLKLAVTFLKQSDLTKYLPKIIVAIDSSLSSLCPRIRLLATELSMEIFKKISNEALCENLSSLVISLFPLLESSDSDNKESNSPLSDLKGFAKLSQNNSLYEPTVLYSDPNDLFSTDMTCICTATFSSQLHPIWIKRAKAEAVNIIVYLFHQRRKDVQDSIKTIAYIPNLPELQDVKLIHMNELSSLSTEQSFMMLCEMINHESSNVREVALNKLLELCCEHRTSLNELIKSISVNGWSRQAGSTDLISILIQDLLQLSSRETDEKVKLLCAKVLGELGAIDPARLRLSRKDKDRSNVNSSNNENVVANRSNHNLTDNFVPWDISVIDFAMYLLEYHLVPGLKSNKAGHDKSGYAIQQILRIMSSELSEKQSSANAKKSKSSNNNTNIIIDLSDDITIFPLPLKELLESKGIFDVTEPFWTTKYTLEKNIKSPPLFNSKQLKFNKWMGYWIRYLTSYSEGALRPIFEACHGSVMSRYELSKFLLPHIVIDILINSSSSSESSNGSNKLFAEIIEEINLVLTSIEKNSSVMSVNADNSPSTPNSELKQDDVLHNNQMAIQALFVLFDIFTSWKFTGNQLISKHQEDLLIQQERQERIRLQEATKMRENGQAYRKDSNQDRNLIHIDNEESRFIDKVQTTVDSINKIVDSISLELLSKASMDVKAYARAMKYVEQQSLFDNNNNNSVIRAGRNNMNDSIDIQSTYHFHGQIPKLDAKKLDQLMFIYAQLEMTDALQGAHTMKRILGYTSTASNRIFELEQKDDWLGALLEYGSIIGTNQKPNNQILVRDKKKINSGIEIQTYSQKPPIGKFITKRDSMSAKHLKSNISINSISHISPLNMTFNTTSSSFTNDKQNKDIPLHIDQPNAAVDDVSELERGRLRCLIELGHLEAVIDQTCGMMQRFPQLENVFLPLGIEASWRLMQWNDLGQFLNRVDEIEESFQTDEQLSSFKSSILSEADLFQISLGRLLLNLYKRDEESFLSELSVSRHQTMSSLATASMESYGRAYPLLTRLHILHEVETGYQLLSINGTTVEDTLLLREQFIQSAHWDNRLHHMSSSVSQRSIVLAARRSVLGICEMPHLIANNWLELSKSMRKLGRYDSAKVAVRRAEGMLLELGITYPSSSISLLNKDDILLEECKILRENKQVNQALLMIEPAEIDIRSIVIDVQNWRKSLSPNNNLDSSYIIPNYISTEEKRIKLSNRILFVTQMLVDNNIRLDKSILDRYKCSTALNKHNEMSYFHYARFYEYLYKNTTKNDLAIMSVLREQPELIMEDTKSYFYVGRSVEKYCDSLIVHSMSLNNVNRSHLNEVANHKQNATASSSPSSTSSQSKVQEAMLRMLTLWLSFTSEVIHDSMYDHITLNSFIQSMSTSTNSSTSMQKSSRNMGNIPFTHIDEKKLKALKQSQIKVLREMLKSAQDNMNNYVASAVKRIKPALWFMCMTQLVSRVGHNNPQTLIIIIDIIKTVLISFPKQSIWHIAGLLSSANNDRKRISKGILSQAYHELVNIPYINNNNNNNNNNRNVGNNNTTTAPEDASMLLDAPKLFHNLVALASTKPKERERKLKWNIPSDIVLSRFLIPTQSILHYCNPLDSTQYDQTLSNLSMKHQLSSISTNYDKMYISHLSDTIDIASSKAKPKIFNIISTCHRSVKFLCKQEREGDLRKDARLMEFNTTVNRLLYSDFETRKNNLRLRTYSVVCLNEECGLLEWVNHTDSLRNCIKTAHEYAGVVAYPHITLKDIYESYTDMQKNNCDNIGVLMKYFKSTLRERYKPCLSRYFLATYIDPTAWLEARNVFTRSCAVWSVIGYIIGLGDRHLENILLDTLNGECVHVDFDCLFDKGLSLNIPEIIPFRLTSNMIENMGPLGIEGVFKLSMEQTLRVLRDHKDALLSILEPFLRDPTVVWSRSGRQQRLESSNYSDSGTTVGGRSESTSHYTDYENKEATEMLKKISDRLDGIYNISHPNREKIIANYKRRNEPLPARGLGALQDEMLPLSVQGQVQRLVEEATADENLAQLFIGWQSWL
eukprot:gene9200-12410_t